MLKILEALNPMTAKVTVFVPATNGDTQVDNCEIAEDTAAFLADLFGGSTVYEAYGMWVDEKSRRVVENTTPVCSNCRVEDLEENLLAVIMHCLELRDAMNQDCIGLEVHDGQKNNMVLIDAETMDKLAAVTVAVAA